MTVEFGSLSSINGSDKMLRCESLPLSRVHSIEDGVLRFFTSCGRSVMRSHSSDRELTSQILRGSSNPGCYNSDKQPRMLHLINELSST